MWSVPDFEDVQYEAADGVGGAARVVEELLERGVALLHDVLPEGVDEVAKERKRQLPFVHSGFDALETRAGASSLLDRIEGLQIGVQAGEALGVGQVALVGNVVGASGEAVDGFDGRAQPRGHEPRSHREVLVMVDRQGSRKRLNFLDYIGPRHPVR